MQDYDRALLVALQMRRYGSSSDWGLSFYPERMVLDSLVLWAASDPSVAVAIAKNLSKYWRKQPPWREPLQVDYVVQSRLIDGMPGTSHEFRVSPFDGRASQIYGLQLLPGEKIRLQRFLRYQTFWELKLFPVLREPAVESLFPDRQLRPKEVLEAWRTSTSCAAWVRPSGEWFVDQMEQLQEARAATGVRLLLIGDYARGGAYPDVQGGNALPVGVLYRIRRLFGRDATQTNDDSPWLNFEFGFRYKRLPRVELSEQLVRLPSHYVEVREPLGRYVADAAGHLALVGRDTYPLPVVRLPTP